jgi:hypothetical protein
LRPRQRAADSAPLSSPSAVEDEEGAARAATATRRMVVAAGDTTRAAADRELNCIIVLPLIKYSCKLLWRVCALGTHTGFCGEDAGWCE